MRGPVEIGTWGQFVEALKISGTQFAGHCVLLVEPLAEVDQAAPLRAERAPLVRKPLPCLTALGALHDGIVSVHGHRESGEMKFGTTD